MSNLPNKKEYDVVNAISELFQEDVSSGKTAVEAAEDILLKGGRIIQAYGDTRELEGRIKQLEATDSALTYHFNPNGEGLQPDMYDGSDILRDELAELKALKDKTHE